MASCREDTAVEKFLKIPELLEKLIPLLDVNSIASLAEVQPMIIKILQRATLWNNLIRRSCLNWKVVNWYSTEQDFEETFERNRIEIANLVKMLKKMEDFNLLLLGLLHVIIRERTNNGFTEVKLSCPGHGLNQCRSHKEWEWRFLFLEEVEGAFGSAVQEIESIKMDYVCGKHFRMRQAWLLAVSSRARRQQTRISLVHIDNFFCTDMAEAKALQTLAENCETMRLRHLRIFGEIGAEGWSALAKALRLHPGCHLFFVEVPKRLMVQGRREDLRNIWDCLFKNPSAQWRLEDRPDATQWDTEQKNKIKEWRRLEEILDKKQKGNKRGFLNKLTTHVMR